MATSNILNPFGFRPVKWQGGGACPTEEFYTTSNLTLLEGDPVVRKADGTIGKIGTTSTAVFGFAAHGVTGTTGVRAKVLIIPATFDKVFEVQAAAGVKVTQTLQVGYPAGVSFGTGYSVAKLGATTSLFTTVGIHPSSVADKSLAVIRVVVAKSSYMGNP